MWFCRFLVFAAEILPLFSQGRLGDPPQAPTAPPVDQTVVPRAPIVFPSWFNPSDRAGIAAAFTNAIVNNRSTPTGWNGNLDTGNAGTTSQEWKDVVLSRINFMRALAGIPPWITFLSTYNTKDQDAAMMMSSNNDLSHTPPTTWRNYTAAGAEAARNSNLCLGYTNDPGCVEAYMRDEGSNNAVVGHRRWFLYPQTQQMGTGDIPRHSTYPYANATWVFDSHFSDPRPSTRDIYVPWPPRGYVPLPLIPGRWSFSYPGADFSNATITMMRGATSISLTLEPVANGYGENAIVWIPNGAVPSPLSGDTTITVTVSNFRVNSVAQSVSYDVIVFDPASAQTLGTPTLLSPSNGSTVSGTSTTLSWSAASGADSYDVYFDTTANPAFLVSTTATSQQVTSLSPGTTYFWKVIAKAGSATAASQTFSFSTQPAAGLAAPTLVAPADGATGVSQPVTLTWNASAGATAYDVSLGTSNPPPAIATTTSTSYTSQLNAGTTYYWRVTAKNGSTAADSSIRWFATAGGSTTVTSGFYFRTITPCRIADTRQSTAIAGGTSRDVPVTGAPCGIPPGAKAVALNVTVVPPATLGFLTLWPAGQPRPLASTLNAPRGGIVANAAIVPVGASGAVSVYVSDTTDVVIDASGYFMQDSAGSAFYALTPCRAADTRESGGILNGTRTFIPGCGIPAGAAAVSLNATVVPSGSLGYLTLWPSGGQQPFVSTLNSPTGKVTANAAIVPLGANGGVDAYATNPTHLVLDVNGYFAAPSTSGLAFYPVTPCRVADTRNSTVMTGNSSRDFQVTAGNCGIPSTARAFALNVTVVPREPLGYLTLWPTGQGQPFVSTLNSPDGSIVANAAIVPSGANGSVSVFVTNATDVVLDVTGYFAP